MDGQEDMSAQSHPSADAGTHIPRSPQAPSVGGWTPGPWKAYSLPLVSHVFDSKGAPEGYRLADVHQYGPASLSKTTREANACLIAAAPMMASALQRIIWATPESTNSATIAQYQSWVRAVAETALADALGVS